MSSLKWPDYLICCVTLVFSLGVGLFYSLKGQKQKSTSKYLYGDGKMSIIPVAMSLIVSYESGILMLGVPAEVYMYGMQWYISQFGYFTVALMAVKVLVPPLKRLNITSIHQYMELRFGSRKLRLFVTVVDMLSSLNYLGFVVFIPAGTINAVSGISKDWSINVIMVIVVVYTLIGGFKAVIWTDVFQSFLLLAGIFSVLIKGTIDAGGISRISRTMAGKGRLNFFDFNPDPTIRQSFWSLFFGSLISGINVQYYQSCFQRIKATRTVKSAQIMYLITHVGLLLMSLLAVLEGAVMFAYYDSKGCDPLVNNEVTNQNQLIAKMVMEIFENIPCLPGLFFAALLSASLSTMSSMLISCSALFLEDIVKPHVKPMSARKAYVITQCSGYYFFCPFFPSAVIFSAIPMITLFLFGGLGVFIAYIVFGVKGPVLQILETIDSCFRGATAGIYLLAWFVPWANTTGAFVGGLLSSVLIVWISYGKHTSNGLRQNPTLEPASTDRCIVHNVSEALWNTTLYQDNTDISQPHAPEGVDILYSISYKWLGALSITVVLVIGSIVSKLQGKTQADPALVVSIWDVLFWFIPRSFRERVTLCDKHSRDTDLDTKQNDTEAEKEQNDSRQELHNLMDISNVRASN